MSSFAERLEALKIAAPKAVSGPWTYQEDSDAYTHIVRRGTALNPHDWVCSAGQSSSQITEDTARYIAAASPDFILELISAYEAATKWIDCKQEMPEYGELVWVVWKGVVQKIAYYRDADEWVDWDRTGDPAPLETFSHWRYVPAPPAPAVKETK